MGCYPLAFSPEMEDYSNLVTPVCFQSDCLAAIDPLDDASYTDTPVSDVLSQAMLVCFGDDYGSQPDHHHHQSVIRLLNLDVGCGGNGDESVIVEVCMALDDHLDKQLEQGGESHQAIAVDDVAQGMGGEAMELSQFRHQIPGGEQTVQCDAAANVMPKQQHVDEVMQQCHDMMAWAKGGDETKMAIAEAPDMRIESQQELAKVDSDEPVGNCKSEGDLKIIEDDEQEDYDQEPLRRTGKEKWVYHAKGCHCRLNDRWEHHYTHIMCYHCSQFHEMKEQFMSVLCTECSSRNNKCPIFEACLHYLFPHGKITDKEDSENSTVFNDYLQLQLHYTDPSI